MKKIVDRFKLAVLGQATEVQPALLEPAGTLVVFDMCPPVATSKGQAFLLPAALHMAAPNEPVGPFPRRAPPPDLRALLATLPEPCTAATRQDRLVICPSAQQVTLELARIQDLKTNKPILLLVLQGHTLRFGQRGRAVSVDISQHAGLPIVVVAHWSPANVSLEVQDANLASERSTAISFDGPPPEQQLVRDVADAAPDPSENITAQTSWCIGLICLIRKGTKRDEIRDFARIVLEEARPLSMEVAAATNLPQGTLYIVPTHVTPLEVDDERFEHWRKVFGWHESINAQCEIVILRNPLANTMRHSALSTAAYAYAAHLDRLTGATLGEAFIPSVFVDDKDARCWFWYHACAGHYLVDEIAIGLKKELEARVDTRRRKEQVTVLKSGPLTELFDAAGRDWLKRRLAREDKKRRTQHLSSWVEHFSAGKDTSNTAAAAFRFFQRDLSVTRSRAACAAMDLWAAASKLSADAGEISRRLGDSEATRNALQERLREHGTEARKCGFEIETMAAMLRCGHSGRFVPTSSIRTPDIELDGDNRIYVECAELTPDTNEVAAARALTSQLLTYLNAQAPKRKRSLLLEVVFQNAETTVNAQPIISRVKPVVLAGVGEISDTVGGCEIRLRELGGWERLWRLETIDEVAPDATWVHASGYGDSSWSPRGLVCNASAVAVTIDTSRRLITSLDHRLRDKASARSRGGQFPDGHPGLCAISLGEVRAAAAKEVLAAAAPLTVSHRDLSALVMFWSEREAVDYVPVARRWYARAILNPAANHPVPQGFLLPDGLLATAVT